MRSSKDYRNEAKVMYAPQKGKLALIYFIYELIIGFVASLGIDYEKIANASSNANLDELSEGVGGYGAAVVSLCAGAFALSFVITICKAFKNEDVKLKDLFSGFKRFFPALILDTLVGLFVGLWTMLFVIPGIIMSFAYSQVYFIMNDHPEYSAMQCIRKSKEMMRGHKAQLFFLNLSYIGHAFLVLLTLGIYGYWLAPKMQMANYLFYLDLKKENGELVEEA